MGIDWFTFFAQIVNFLILAWLLKVFLYKPVTNAMRKREEHIAQRLDEAEREGQEAENLSREYEEKARDLESRREEMLARAREEAEEERKKLSEAGRRQVDDDRERWRESLNREKQAFLRALRRRAGEQVRDALTTALESLADRDLERSITGVFLSRLEDLDTENRKRFLEAAKEDSHNIVVRSAFPVDDNLRGSIAVAFEKIAPDTVNLKWEVDADLIAGIEARTGGYKIAWSLRDHLHRVGEDLFHELEREGDRDSAKKPTESDAVEAVTGTTSAGEAAR